MTVDEVSIASTSPQGFRDHVQAIEDRLDHHSRDKLFQLVIRTSILKVVIPSFPSLDLLDGLIETFLNQDKKALVMRIHPATFNCRKVRTELLLAVIASGSTWIAMTPIWKMGHILQDIVRLAVVELVSHTVSFPSCAYLC